MDDLKHQIKISFSITENIDYIKEKIYRFDYTKFKSSMPPRNIKNKIKSK